MSSLMHRPEKITAYLTILRTEMDYLKRRTGGQRTRLHWVFIWLIVFIALIAFVWRVVNIISQEPSFFYWLATTLKLEVTNYFGKGGVRDMLAPLTPLSLLFPLSVVIWNFWLMFQTLVMSTHSITRERNRNNWELLLVTSIDIRTIIRAKWEAVIRHQWRDYALLAIMRIGVISFLAMSFSVDLTYGDPPFFSYGRAGPEVEPQITIVFSIAIAIMFLSAVIIALLTMLDLMFTAACGIVGGWVTHRTSLALPCSIGIRLLLVIVVALLLGVPSYLAIKPDLENSIGYYPDPVFNTVALIAGLTGATMLDQGSIAAGFLMRYGYNFRWSSTFNGFWFFSDTLRGHGPAYLTALLLSIVICIFLTSILMWGAGKFISRQS